MRKTYLLLTLCTLFAAAASAQNMYQIYDRQGELLTEIPFAKVDSIKFTKMLRSDTAQWRKFADGNLTKSCWQDSTETEMYYRYTEFDDIFYCKITAAWTYHFGANSMYVHYFFYWDTKTNYLYVPMSFMFQRYEHEGTVYDIYYSDGSSFYNASKDLGHIVPSREYFEWAPQYAEENGLFQPYYDGNGTFYLADYYYLCQDDVPTNKGFQFGGNPDYFIADGYNHKNAVQRRTSFSVDRQLDLIPLKKEFLITE